MNASDLREESAIEIDSIERTLVEAHLRSLGA